jgi:hypothetical protein
LILIDRRRDGKLALLIVGFLALVVGMAPFWLYRAMLYLPADANQFFNTGSKMKTTSTKDLLLYLLFQCI